ncbi:MAG: response regulator transcription factor [Clostridiaceae bacterium]|jgi:LuxR family maltose regulon positive regulatory protein|nr:response regulator transcription factor [Clostridiaceae bacterium]
MKKKPDIILLKIENAVVNREYDKALTLIEENAAVLFSYRDVKPVIALIGDIPEDRFKTPLQKLILCWTCFLCADSGRMNRILAGLVPERFGPAVEKSIFYSLKAVSTFMCNREEALGCARLSVELMEKEPNSFYAASARLTYGQLLSSVGDHRKAAHEFFAAYRIFKKHKSYLPAVASLVNYGIKKHALGEIADVVTLLRNELTACSRYDSAFQLLKLPLGIAYFEMNRQNMAVKYLESVKELMYQMDFVHMYGVLEMYLVYAYGISGLYRRAYALIDELSGRLSRLNFENISTFCAALRAHINLLEGVPVSNSDKRLLEADYLTGGKSTPIGTLLILARLMLNGDMDSFSMNDLIAWQETPDTVKNVPFAQTAAILTAEYYYRMREMTYCREYLEKAVAIYTNFRLSARFLTEKAECLNLLKEINRDLYNMVKSRQDLKPTSVVLTPKEQEILSLMAQGLSDRQIADRLGVGIGTTKCHVSSILSKLHVSRRAKAIAQAKKLGLL